ncbi:MAG: PAS domain-containing protein [Lachnospiraceae bacterium]|nr:PAS domain-containing protein [Lachnospiraceae bacterium]
MNKNTGDIAAENKLDLGMTSKLNGQIMEGIINGMSDGVLLVSPGGRVQYANPTISTILDKQPEELIGHPLASLFYKYSENDLFNQTLLDAVIDPEKKQYDTVPYFTGEKTKQLHVMTSVLWLKDTRGGIIMLINDITEIASLKIRYAQQITALLDSLVKALSTAIDERSHYTANHTRNMVQMGRNFMDWLEERDAPLQFEGEKKRAFLMSVWLHDVGKLIIPLEIMDKATRLSDRIDQIEKRLDRMHLLDKIALLEGRIDEAAYQTRESQRDEQLAAIRRIDQAGYLSEEDLSFIESMADLEFEDEDGTKRPLLTEDELKCLRIRKGTLTDDERSQMQGHVIMTRRILEKVQFPDAYTDVPDWASMHHELINGTGYPDHKANDEIPPEVRLLTILDIYEALTAKDRPYKKPFRRKKPLGFCITWQTKEAWIPIS